MPAYRKVLFHKVMVQESVKGAWIQSVEVITGSHRHPIIANQKIKKSAESDRVGKQPTKDTSLLKLVFAFTVSDLRMNVF